MLEQSERGLKMSRVVLDCSDLSLKGRLQYAHEEAVDKALYPKRVIKEMEWDGG